MSSENGNLDFRATAIVAVVLPLFITVAVECLKFNNIILEEPDKFVFYWKVYLLSERVKAPRKDVAIVYIDDRSLLNYPYRSPIDRAFLATLVRDIDGFGPRAIGLDLVFDRPTEADRDNALIEAVNHAKAPVILVRTDSSEAGISRDALNWQSGYLARTKALIASPLLDTETTTFSLGDDVIRTMAPYEPKDNEAMPFALALAKQVKPLVNPDSRLIDWLLPGKDGQEVFSTLMAPSAPRVDPKTQDRRVLPVFMKAALANRIVIVGGMLAGSDWHRVPMTVATNREAPGASIHAEIVAQLLDGRTIAPVPEWISALIILFATLGIYVIREAVGKHHPEIFIEFLLIGAIVVFGSLMFWLYRINFPSAELGLMWLLLSLTSKYVEKLVVWAVRKYAKPLEVASSNPVSESQP